ncbi:Uncharacterised protein [BD1-7 clade bacterium]|uniref:SSD domain-containing protein n=1 Tax=BD1-7 clade bacterium TaxID=2029982 RepID=A0A5S9QPW9_9GAMM|nr:Uncharacterised protein [BD1-7 clade bacterium]CAA0121301.1 Uncharacterised protein [BD1-7 clade bacterium]
MSVSLYERLMRYPGWLLIAILVVTSILASRIPQLQIDASSDSLVLQGDHSLAVYREVAKRYDSSDFLMLAITPDNGLYAQDTLDFMRSLTDQLAALQGVKSVISYLNVPLLYSPKVNLSSFSDDLHYLGEPDTDTTLARKEFLESPIYKTLLTSADERTTAVVINLDRPDQLIQLRNERDALMADSTANAAQRKSAMAAYEKALQQRTAEEERLVADVRSLASQYRTHGAIFVGGVPMIVSDMLRFVRMDMVVFGSAIMLFIIVTLALIFRKMRWVVLPLLSCGLTCIAMLGSLAWLQIKLTVVSANFVALLLIISLSITLHLVVRFIEEEKRNADLPQRELVLRAMGSMIKPCTYTTLTTMVAFLSLVVSDIKPIVDFGWMMTVAVALALSMGFFVLPAGLLLLRKPEVEEARDTATSGFTRAMAGWSYRHRTSVLVGSLGLLVFSIAGVMQLKVENRFIDYFHPSTEIYQGMLTVDQQLGGTLPLTIVIDHVAQATTPHSAVDDAYGNDASSDAASDDDFFGDDAFSEDFVSDEVATPYDLSYWFSRAGLEDIQRIHQFIDAQPDTGKVLSLATLAEVVRDISGGNVDDIQLAIVKKNLDGDIKKTLVSPYLSEDGTQTRISVRVRETSESLDRGGLLNSIDRFLQDDMGYQPDQYEITGMMVLYNNMLQSLYRSQILTLGAVFIAIMLMFALLFRSLKVSLLAILPNILAALLVLGGMGWIGIPLDIMTITIAAITVGIGVDDTIHYIHRFKHELAKDGDYVQSMYRCHGSVGLAMTYTSLTIIVGFSILALSNFTPSIYFGLLTSTAMFAALLGALLLLPQLLLFFKPFGADRGVS